MDQKYKEEGNSYNQIAKATGIFGGVQVIGIFLSIIRSKFVAILLETTGVGVMGLYTATTGLIASLTNFGIGFSAVRTISAADSSEDQNLISRTIITLQRWVTFTGLLGAVITLVMAKKLSQWTFGNTEYTFAFIWLSITLLFQALSNGQLALLQGLRKLRQLAVANVAGSFLGLCFSIPLYYWFGLKGIVPSLIISAGLSLILSWYFARKIKVKKVKIPYTNSIVDGLDMVKLGSVMMITGFATMGVTYLIRMFISRFGTLEQVGLYTAAWSIINGYVGMVFTAMGTDYFPRLSAVNQNNQQVNRLVNEQAEIAVLILGPILILLLSALPLVIRILLTTKFLPIMGLIQWALIGILFKAASWSIAFIMLAKGASRIFFISEMIANGIILASNILLYHYFQLNGIGMAFFISYLLYLILVYIIAKVKYNFSFSVELIRLFLIQFVLVASASFVSWYTGFPKAYLYGTILLLLSAAYSFFEIRKRINFKALLYRFKK